jgi:SAM-dependent methyltransferase
MSVTAMTVSSAQAASVAGVPARRIGLEASKTFDRKAAEGFVAKYLSGPCILDIGYRGYSPDVEPIVPQAIGVELDFPGYDGRTLPFGDCTQDAVFASHCLEHIDDFCNALREWHRVLRVDGHMVIAVPHQFLYEKRTRLPSRWNADHKRFYTPASLMAEIEQSLEPNTYRLRHLIDNDLGYDYTVPPSLHAGGCYEIELVLQRIAPPAWMLEEPDEPEAAAEPHAVAVSLSPVPALQEAGRSPLQKLAGLYGKLRTLPRHIVRSLDKITAEVTRQGDLHTADKIETEQALRRVQAGIVRCQNSVADAMYTIQRSVAQLPGLGDMAHDARAALGGVETLMGAAQPSAATVGGMRALPAGDAGYDASRRLCFMHIPKTAGTALRQALGRALEPLPVVGGFDHVLFGGFTDFATLGDDTLRHIYHSVAAMPQAPATIAGHFAYSTLRGAYPDCQMITILREPVSRALSHWTYWRKHLPDASDPWGAWADYVREAQRPLHEFLAEPKIAAQTDNVALRMLLWPHPLVPDAGFIDPMHDGQLLGEALARLAGFALVDIPEEPGLNDRMGAWLGRPFIYEHVNQTEDVPPAVRVPFESQIGEASLELLHQRSRIDLKLWQSVALRHRSEAACDRLREQTILGNVARYSALMVAPAT